MNANVSSGVQGAGAAGVLDGAGAADVQGAVGAADVQRAGAADVQGAVDAAGVQDSASAALNAQIEIPTDPTKSPGWYTAFYRYAEYVRALTHGALNHKHLYAYVGTSGRYVNSKNAALRKRTASGLSHLLHSPRYAADFRESLRNNPQIFQVAAANLAQDLLRETGLSQELLVSQLLRNGYAQVRAGLVAEIPEGRIEVSIARLDGEMELLRTWAREQLAAGGEAGAADASVAGAATEAGAATAETAGEAGAAAETTCLQAVLSSFFYILTFGHLEESFANSLVDGSPTDMLATSENEQAATNLRACVMRAVDNNPAAIENMWAISQGGPFFIGRYVDCDAVETNGLVSRRHCSIFRQGDTWYVRDEGSRYGTALHRGGQVLWNSKDANAPQQFSLAFGDCLVLAGRVHYWFVSLQNVERLLIG